MPSATTMAMTSGPQLVLKKSIMDAEPRHAVLAVHRSGLPPDRARFQGDRESSQRCSPMTRVQSSASTWHDDRRTPGGFVEQSPRYQDRRNDHDAGGYHSRDRR